MSGLFLINFVSWVGPFGPDHHLTGVRTCGAAPRTPWYDEDSRAY